MPRSRMTVIAVLALTVTTAVAHGVVTSRWSGGRDNKPTIPDVPTVIGEWVGTDDNTDIDDRNLANLTRKYTHRRTGRWFVMSLTAGHPGLTAVHTPEYCYRGSGYEPVGPIERRPLLIKGDTAAAFWTTQFEKKSAAGMEQLRVFWTWSAGGGWAAPDSPRWHYLGKSSLYKLYVVGPGQSDVSPGKDAALDDFLTALLSTLDRSLFAPSAQTTP